MPPAPTDLFERMAPALHERRYHLILGAGASIGAIAANGTPLLDSSQFSKVLLDYFQIPHSPDRKVPLARAYQLALGKARQEGLLDDLNNLLSEHFTGCTPPSWYEHLVKWHWDYIWTLNIDDVAEAAYRSFGGSRGIRTLSFGDAFSPSREDLHLIHLHGLAGKEVVFARDEYQQAIAADGSWHRVFSDWLPSIPIVVIGARMVDEVDLAHTFANAGEFRTGHPYPSVIVRPDPPPEDRFEYQSWGFTLFDGTAEDFFAALDAHLPTSPPAIDTLPAATAVAFARSFVARSAQAGADERAAVDHDFYAGEAPNWNDIQRELPGARSAATDAATAIREHWSARETAVVAVVGRRFSGRSTALYLAAHELARAGMEVWEFADDYTFSPADVMDWGMRRPDTVVMIDDAEPYESEIYELLKLAKTGGYQPLVLITTSETGARNIERTLTADASLGAGFLQTAPLDPVSAGDAAAITLKLEAAGRLGALFQRPRERRAHAFEGKPLFDVLAGLAHADMFEKRFAIALGSALAESWHTKLYFLLSLAETAAAEPVPFAVIQRLVGVRPGQILREVTSVHTDAGGLSDFVGLEGETRGELKLRLRHRALAARLTPRLRERVDVFVCLTELAETLAPFISPSAISARSLHYRIAKKVMDAQFISEALQGGQAGQDFYAQIEAAYEWNARFWEQRGLHAAGVEKWDLAVSYCRKAEALFPGAYSKNTLATVLMRRALSDPFLNESARWQCIQEAWQFLKRAIDRDERGSEYPYTTFFSYTRRYLERSSTTLSQPMISEASAAWEDFVRLAREAPAFRLPDDRKRLDALAGRPQLFAPTRRQL
jgi:SIR2-like domain